MPELNCGCKIEFVSIECDEKEERFVIRVRLCDQHNDVNIALGSSYLRLEPINRGIRKNGRS